MKNNKPVSVTTSPASRSKKTVSHLTEAESNLLLARIAGQLGISDARSLPYMAAFSGNK